MVRGCELYTKEAYLINSAKRELADGQEKEAIYKLRLMCLTQGATGLMKLARAFRHADTDGQALNLEKFAAGMRASNLGLTDPEIKDMFEKIQHDDKENMNTSQLIEQIRPPMPQCRVDIIDKAFEKMDTEKSGVTTFKIMKKAYKVRDHPKYMTGEMSAQQIYDEFLMNFGTDSSNDDAQVTKEEFINYYASVSASIDNDGFFDLLLRRQFKI